MGTTARDTFFAPAEREDQQRITEQRKTLESSEFLNRVLSRSPWMFLILNDKRQIIYSNASMVSYLGYSSMEELMGFRPGETIECIHADEGPSGCGTSEKCRYCGVVQTILKGRKSEEPVTGDAIILFRKDGRVMQGEFRITSMNFEWKGEQFNMLTFNDISIEKRKEQLERIFFHDILNKAGTLSQMVELMRVQVPEVGDNPVFELLERGVDEFVQDIYYQQKLHLAEAGKLEVNPVEVRVHSLVKTVIEDYSVHALMKSIKVKESISGTNENIVTDIVLIRRILGNLLKNAIEATEKNGTIEISFEQKDKNAVFSVNNPGEIHDSIKDQIFARSVSTKGIGRGIGTYSIKLFTEQFLNGKTWFTSSNEEGTTFYISLPV